MTITIWCCWLWPSTGWVRIIGWAWWLGSVQEKCSLSSHSPAYRVHLSIQGCVDLRKERPNSMILSFLLFSCVCLLIFFSCILLMDCNLSPGFYCSYKGFSLPCLVPHICGYGWVAEAPTLPLLLSCSYYATKALAFVLFPAYSWRK